MSLPITTSADYVGKVNISTNSFSSLDSYISEIEPEIILEVLNPDCLYEIETEVSLKSKYTDLIAGGYYTNSDGDRVKFRGLKDFIKYYVYSYYNTDSFNNSIIGNVKNISENSTYSGSVNSQIVYDRWNKAVEIYEADITTFLNEYQEIKQTITNSTDNTGTYTLEIPSTKYVYAGDTIYIGGVEYTIFSLVDNTSIDIIEASSGLDFTGLEVSWKPFFELEYYKYDFAWL